MLKLMASSVHGAQIKEKQRKISIRSTYGVQFATIFFVSVRFKGPRMTAAPAVPLVSAVLGPPCNALLDDHRRLGEGSIYVFEL